MDLRRELCRRDAKVRRKINYRAAAQAVAAARKSVVVLMLMMRRWFSAVMRVLFRAGLGVSIAQMEHGMRIAARKRERRQHD
jgi:predicted transcriptional regulator